jgi:hypothetical protein
MNATEKDNSNYALSIKGPPGAAMFHPSSSMAYYVDHIQSSFTARVQAPPPKQKQNKATCFTFYLKGNSSDSSHAGREKNVRVSLIWKGASSSSSPAQFFLYKREADHVSEFKSVTCDASQIMNEYCHWTIAFRNLPTKKTTECVLTMKNAETGYRHTQAFHLNSFVLHTFTSMVIGGPQQDSNHNGDNSVLRTVLPLVSMKYNSRILVSYGSQRRPQRQKHADIPVRLLIRQTSQRPKAEKSQILHYKDELSCFNASITKPPNERGQKAETSSSALRTHYAMALERPSERVKRVRVVCNGDTSEENEDGNASKNHKGDSIKTNFWDFLSVFITFLLTTIAVKLVTARICSSPTTQSYTMHRANQVEGGATLTKRA